MKKLHLFEVEREVFNNQTDHAMTLKGWLPFWAEDPDKPFNILSAANVTQTMDWRIMWCADAPDGYDYADFTFGATGDYIPPEDYESADGYIQFEFDQSYFGGDYSGVGEFCLVPMKLISQARPILSEKEPEHLAFECWTGIDSKHIIHFSPDELFDSKGNLKD